MNSFKLLVVFILLLFGSFAQRFQRHSINGTQNGLSNSNTEMNNLDVLSSDGENAVKFVRNGEEVELELDYDMLAFDFCSVGCMGETGAQIQKKPLFGKKKNVQQTADIPEASKKANFVKEKTADEKEVVAKPESTKEATKEESTVTKEKQPAKKKLAKEKKAPIVEAKPSKEVTQENGINEDAKKVSIEPTLQDVTTDTSVVQKSVVKQKQPGNRPRVFVPKKVILPAMNSDGFKSVSVFDTLSGAEDDKTQHSTHASEKSRKNEFAGRKKGSKKHR